MKVVEYLLESVSNWHEIIAVRHIKFVESYFSYKKQLKVMATAYNYSESDMLCVFWRIQRQLFVAYINQASAGQIKPGKVPDKFNEFLLWSLQQYRDDAMFIYNNIKGLDNPKNKVEKKKVIAFPRTLN
ncbi:hypothetical protein D3C87_81520 [compost metagenome]